MLAHGPNVSLDVVAAELEISTPALLKRFGTRQALMLAALKPPEKPDWIRLLDEGPTGEPLEDQLRAIFSGAAEFMDQWVPCIIALRESGIPPETIFQSKKKGPEVAVQSLKRWLVRAGERGLVTIPETEAAAFVIFGALQTRVFFAHTVRLKFSERAQRQYFEDLASFFARALSTGPSKQPSKHT